MTSATVGEICSINEAQECVPDKPISMPYRHEFTGEGMGGFGVYNVCEGEVRSVKA